MRNGIEVSKIFQRGIVLKSTSKPQHNEINANKCITVYKNVFTILLLKMVRPERFELPPFSLEGRCPIQLDHRRLFIMTIWTKYYIFLLHDSYSKIAS